MSTITQKECLTFIELFESKTKHLLEPMISFFGEGAMSKEQAIDFINKAKKMPEALVICGKKKNDDYWNSAYIFKTEDIFLVEADDHSGIQNVVTNSLNDAMSAAAKIVEEYENL